MTSSHERRRIRSRSPRKSNDGRRSLRGSVYVDKEQRDRRLSKSRSRSPRKRSRSRSPSRKSSRSRSARSLTRKNSMQSHPMRTPRRRSRSRSPYRRQRSRSRSPRRRSPSRSPRRYSPSRSPQRRSPSRSPRHRSRSRSLIRARSRSRSPISNSRRERERADKRAKVRPTNKSRSPKKEGIGDDGPKPNFGLSGKLAAETNSYNGIPLKYFEPQEARKPVKKWRLYVFKGDKELDILHIHRQSAYLFGRERKVADIPIDHPSCSSQHAVLQFRQITSTDNETGEKFSEVKPYIIDLDSTNKTFVNNNAIPPSRYYELKASDTIKFGFML
ncbi:smad nuclear-interacting protein 1 [Rhizophagus clarus]|uniref:Smad nuclear-interacting protein 1 n=1 Tax=Rhizophagus clarus TaxID=94130 RepID=A0A8H3KVC6_9GLOM|nr:smad nuclear-interacting protein 1 [Rhizophagus clarus]